MAAMRWPGRIGLALAVALVVGLVATAARVERWLGGGRPTRLVFEVSLPDIRHADRDQVIEAAWRVRLRGRSPEIRRGAGPSQVIVTVDGTTADGDALSGALERPGQLELYEVVNDTAVARRWYARAHGGALGPDVRGVPDSWTNDRTGEIFTDYYLTAPTVAALDDAIGRLSADDPVPDDLRVVHERVVPPPEVEGARPHVRTYLVAAPPHLDGRAIARASVSYDQYTMRPDVVVHFTAEGTHRFAELTAAMVGRKLAIVLDDVVTSAPIVQQAIEGGATTIRMGAASSADVEAQAHALVAALRTGGALPDGIRATLSEARAGKAGLTWPPRIAVALLAGILGFFLAGWLARRVMPVLEVPTARGLRGVPQVAFAAALTVGLPALLIWLAGSGELPLPYVNSVVLDGIAAGGGGASSAFYAQVSVFALGVLPIVSAFWVVELVAAVVPRWRATRLGPAAGRRGLDRATLIVGFVLAALQGYFVVKYLASFDGRGAAVVVDGPWHHPMLILTLLAGVSVHVIVAELITRRGLCNGYLALIGVAAAHALYARLAAAPMPGLRDHRVALLAAVLALAVVAVVVTALRDRRTRTRQPWPVLTALVGLGEAIGLVMLLVFAVDLVGWGPVDGARLAWFTSRPLWFDVLFSAGALALVVRWQRLEITGLALATAAALLATLYAVRWLTPPVLAFATMILPATYIAFLAVEVALALRARAGMVAPVAVLAVHDVDRADRAADVLAAAGIAASVENLRLRAFLRGLASYAPIVIRVAAADAEGAVAVIAGAEADRDPRVAAFVG